jgi:hypothetical protein
MARDNVEAWFGFKKAWFALETRDSIDYHVKVELVVDRGNSDLDSGLHQPLIYYGICS